MRWPPRPKPRAGPPTPRSDGPPVPPAILSKPFGQAGTPVVPPSPTAVGSAPPNPVRARGSSGRAREGLLGSHCATPGGMRHPPVILAVVLVVTLLGLV